eukprot:Rmarinus@m.7485
MAPSLTSAPLEAAFFYHKCYYPFYFIVIVSAIIAKDMKFSYPSSGYATEASVVILLFLLESLRLKYGSRGNRLESSSLIFFFLLMTVLAVFGYVYFMQLQTYVYRIDVIASVVSLAFTIFEGLFGFFVMLSFSGSARGRLMQRSD